MKLNWRNCTGYIVLCMLAVLGNVVSLPFFFGIDFLFGSIFVFVILGIHGYLAAIPASLLAASYTYLLWNHPYAIFIFFAELVIVGYLQQRRDINFSVSTITLLLFVSRSIVHSLFRLEHASNNLSTRMAKGEAINWPKSFNELNQNKMLLENRVEKRTKDQHDQYIQRYRYTQIPKVIGIGREVMGKRKNRDTFRMQRK